MNNKTKNTTVPELRFPEFQGTGEWEEKKLGEIVDQILEKVGSQKLLTVSITAGLGFVSQAEKFGRDISGAQYKNYIVLCKGEFAYNKGNSKTFPQGAIYELREFDRVAAPNAFYSFKFKNGFVGRFFQGYFDNNAHGKQLMKFITSGARADGLLNISSQNFFGISFLVPKLPAEQQKIADCLSSLDELIAARSAKLEALKAHKRGLMQALFPAEGETEPKLRFPEFQSAGAWEEKELKQLGNLVSGLTYSPEDVTENGLLVLRSSNIQNGEIALDDCVYVKPTVKGAHLSRPNDILICVRNGSKALIGKNALIPENMPLSTHGAFMTVFRSPYAKFVFQLFKTDLYNKQVSADLGATINSINGSQLLKYKFYIPQEAEQQKIADCLSSLDSLITAQAQQIESLKRHKKGLMQGLFPPTGLQQT